MNASPNQSLQPTSAELLSLRHNQIMKRKWTLILCAVGLLVIAIAVYLVGGRDNPPLRAGMTEKECRVYAQAQEQSAQNQWWRTRDVVYMQVTPSDAVLSARYYFRNGHYFFFRSQMLHFTNGTLALITTHREWRPFKL